MGRASRTVLAAVAAAAALVACGYTEEEMAAKNRQIEALRAEARLAQQEIARDEESNASAAAQLSALGDEVSRLSAAGDLCNERRALLPPSPPSAGSRLERVDGGPQVADVEP
jgi:hypothetical protein